MQKVPPTGATLWKGKFRPHLGERPLTNINFEKGQKGRWARQGERLHYKK